MSLMNSSKQLNTSIEARKRHFANTDVADVPRSCNPCQCQTSFIAERRVRIAYNFMCNLQNNPILI